MQPNQSISLTDYRNLRHALKHIKGIKCSELIVSDDIEASSIISPIANSMSSGTKNPKASSPTQKDVTARTVNQNHNYVAPVKKRKKIPPGAKHIFHQILVPIEPKDETCQDETTFVTTKLQATEKLPPLKLHSQTNVFREDIERSKNKWVNAQYNNQNVSQKTLLLLREQAASHKPKNNSSISSGYLTQPECYRYRGAKRPFTPIYGGGSEVKSSKPPLNAFNSVMVRMGLKLTLPKLNPRALLHQQLTLSGGEEPPDAEEEEDQNVEGHTDTRNRNEHIDGCTKHIILRNNKGEGRRDYEATDHYEATVDKTPDEHVQEVIHNARCIRAQKKATVMEKMDQRDHLRLMAAHLSVLAPQVEATYLRGAMWQTITQVILFRFWEVSARIRAARIFARLVLPMWKRQHKRRQMRAVRRFMSAMCRKRAARPTTDDLRNAGPLFAKWPEWILNQLVKRMQGETHLPGRPLFNKGDPSFVMYYLANGKLLATMPRYKQGQGAGVPKTKPRKKQNCNITNNSNSKDNGENTPTEANGDDSFSEFSQQTFEAGCYIGECGVYADQPREFSATCGGWCDLYSISREVFVLALKKLPQGIADEVITELETQMMYLYPMKLTQLMASPMFKQWSQSDLATLLSELQPRVYREGATIVHQGDTFGCMYFIARGQVTLTYNRSSRSVSPMVGTMGVGSNGDKLWDYMNQKLEGKGAALATSTMHSFKVTSKTLVGPDDSFILESGPPSPTSQSQPQHRSPRPTDSPSISRQPSMRSSGRNSSFVKDAKRTRNWTQQYSLKGGLHFGERSCLFVESHAFTAVARTSVQTWILPRQLLLSHLLQHVDWFLQTKTLLNQQAAKQTALLDYKLFSHCKIFEGIPQTVLHKCYKCMRPVTVEAAIPFIEKDTPIQHLYFILIGDVTYKQGTEKVHFRDGDVIGNKLILTRKNWMSTITTETRTDMWSLSLQTFIDILFSDPNPAQFQALQKVAHLQLNFPQNSFLPTQGDDHFGGSPSSTNFTGSPSSSSTHNRAARASVFSTTTATNRTVVESKPGTAASSVVGTSPTTSASFKHPLMEDGFQF